MRMEGKGWRVEMREIGKMGSKKGKIKINEEINMKMRINEGARVRRKGIIISLFPISFPLLTILAITLFLTLLFFIPLSFSPPRYYCWYYQYYSGPQLCTDYINSRTVNINIGGNVWTDNNGKSHCLYEEKESDSYVVMCTRFGNLFYNDYNKYKNTLKSWNLPVDPISSSTYFLGKCEYAYYYKSMSVEDTCTQKIGSYYDHACVDTSSNTLLAYGRNGGPYGGQTLDSICDEYSRKVNEDYYMEVFADDKCCDSWGCIFGEVSLTSACSYLGGSYYRNVCVSSGGTVYLSESALCSAATDTDPHGRTRNGEYDNGECKWRTTAVIPGNNLCSYYYSQNGEYGTKTGSTNNYNDGHIDKTRDESYDSASETCSFDKVKSVPIETLCKQVTNNAPNAYIAVTDSSGKILYELCRVKRKAW